MESITYHRDSLETALINAHSVQKQLKEGVGSGHTSVVFSTTALVLDNFF